MWRSAVAIPNNLQRAYTLGLEHNLKALDLYTTKPDSAGISHAENNLGALHAMLKDHGKDIEHSSKNPRDHDRSEGPAESQYDRRTGQQLPKER